MSENWRDPIDFYDALLHNQKRVAIEQRRPVIRRAADLVGPGIGSGAVRVTDWNDSLALFDGYYASVQGALNAPNLTDNFVGSVISDDTLGGVQVLYSLTTGREYRRYFNRSAVDPTTLVWSAWAAPLLTPSTLVSTASTGTVTPNGVLTTLAPPVVTAKGPSGVFTAVADGVLIERAGVYTGSIRFGLTTNQPMAEVRIVYPSNGESVTDVLYPGVRAAVLPLHFYHDGSQINGATPGVQVQVLQSTAASPTCSFSRLALTRLPEVPAL